MGLAAVWKLCAEAARDPSGGSAGLRWAALGWLESGAQGTGQEHARAAVNLTREEGEDRISLYPLSNHGVNTYYTQGLRGHSARKGWVVEWALGKVSSEARQGYTGTSEATRQGAGQGSMKDQTTALAVEQPQPWVRQETVGELRGVNRRRHLACPSGFCLGPLN